MVRLQVLLLSGNDQRDGEGFDAAIGMGNHGCMIIWAAEQQR